MKSKLEGTRGESLAVGYLIENGYKILQTNAKLIGIEVDIIAQSKEGAIVFIEVKTRQSYAFGHPFEQISARQQNRYRQFAKMYINEKKLFNTDVRFDAIAVIGNDVEHIANAF